MPLSESDRSTYFEIWIQFSNVDALVWLNNGAVTSSAKRAGVPIEFMDLYENLNPDAAQLNDLFSAISAPKSVGFSYVNSTVVALNAGNNSVLWCQFPSSVGISVAQGHCVQIAEKCSNLSQLDVNDINKVEQIKSSLKSFAKQNQFESTDSGHQNSFEPDLSDSYEPETADLEDYDDAVSVNDIEDLFNDFETDASANENEAEASLETNFSAESDDETSSSRVSPLLETEALGSADSEEDIGSDDVDDLFS